MAFVLFNLAAVAALVGIDQLIKLWASNVLQPVGAMPLIPHVVELRFVLNQGMAFGKNDSGITGDGHGDFRCVIDSKKQKSIVYIGRRECPAIKTACRPYPA